MARAFAIIEAVAPPVRIVPLGGLGEVGMNCLALACDGHVVAVDCGIMFPGEGMGGETLAPDLTWLRHQAERLDAVFLTHGHEDHVGALGHVLRRQNVPVYGTAFTLALARRRLDEAGIRAKLVPVEPGQHLSAGPFSAEPVAVSHSIPEGVAYAFGTPQGTLLHTGDFKIDEQPEHGRPFDVARFAALGTAGVRALLSDSTNAERAGRSPREASIRPALAALVAEAPGRVFVACFASNVSRVQMLVDAAAAAGRRVALLGRAMEHVFRVAVPMGLLKVPAGLLVGSPEAGWLDRRELLVLATGTQGEPRSALARLARDVHREVKIDKGDRVIFSSRVIPGSERAFAEVVNDLYRLGAEVVVDGERRIHATGHACQEEQKQVLGLARPRDFVPIHGEYRMLARHLGLAAESGVGESGRHLLTDGGVLELSDAGSRILEERVPAGRVFAGLTGEEIADAVLRDRKLLAEAGVVVAIVLRAPGTGELLQPVTLYARGVPGFADREAEVRAEVARAIGPPAAPGAHPDLAEEVRLAVRRVFRRDGLQKPVVVPVLLDV